MNLFSAAGAIPEGYKVIGPFVKKCFKVL